MSSEWVDFYNGDMPTIERMTARFLEITAPVQEHQSNIVTAPVEDFKVGDVLVDGYWDDEYMRQWHYEVKGG